MINEITYGGILYYTVIHFLLHPACLLVRENIGQDGAADAVPGTGDGASHAHGVGHIAFAEERHDIARHPARAAADEDVERALRQLLEILASGGMEPGAHGTEAAGGEIFG